MFPAIFFCQRVRRVLHVLYHERRQRHSWTLLSGVIGISGRQTWKDVDYAADRG
jgi:hypothetical protein